jgi:hypothetical protein
MPILEGTFDPERMTAEMIAVVMGAALRTQIEVRKLLIAGEVLYEDVLVDAAQEMLDAWKTTGVIK